MGPMTGKPATVALELLRERVRAAERALDVVRGALNAAMCAGHPYKVGDILQATDGTVAKVVCVYVQYDQVKVQAALRNKDGKFGLRDAPLYRSAWKDAVVIGHEPLVDSAVPPWMSSPTLVPVSQGGKEVV